MNIKSFCLAWVDAVNEQRGVAHVAKKMNISVKVASIKAAQLRKMGVNLPAMPRNANPRYTVDELNELIAARI